MTMSLEGGKKAQLHFNRKLMNLDLLSLKGKKPTKKKTRRQSSRPLLDWFSQGNWFFPALLAWNTSQPWERHLLHRQQAAALLPGRWPRTSFIGTNSLNIRPCGTTQRETLQLIQTGGHNRNLSVHESCRSNQSPSLSLLALSRQRAHALGAASLKTGKAAQSLRKPVPTTSHPDKCPNKAMLLLCWDVWSQALSSQHCVSSSSLCISNRLGWRENLKSWKD